MKNQPSGSTPFTFTRPAVADGGAVTLTRELLNWMFVPRVFPNQISGSTSKEACPRPVFKGVFNGASSADPTCPLGGPTGKFRTF